MKTVRRRAFTLTELLVVIGIIALLTAIAFPVMGGVRSRAQATTCLSNTKQYALAMQAYTQDYDGNYPLVTTAIFTNGTSHEQSVLSWHDLLSPYSKGKSLRCPLRELRPSETESAKTLGYAMNSDLNDDVSVGKVSKYNVGKNEATVAFPSRIVTVFDARVGILSVNHPDVPVSSDDTDLLKQTPGAARHNAGANYAFDDGHARWIPLNSFVVNNHVVYECKDSENLPCFTP